MEDIFQAKHKLPSQHAYALVDRLLIPDLDEQVNKFELISPVLAPQAHLYPWLIPMYDLPYEYWDRFIKKSVISEGEEPFISFFFNSSQSLDQIKRNLINALYLKDPNGSGYIVRYYDPSVFFQYCWFLGAKGIQNFLSMDTSFEATIYYVNQWHTLSTANNEKCGSKIDRVKPNDFIMFSKCVMPINNLISKIKNKSEIIAESKKAYQAMVLAIKSFGLEQSKDLEVFADIYLNYDKNFYKKEEFQEILKQSASNPGYFSLESTYLLKQEGIYNV